MINETKVGIQVNSDGAQIVARSDRTGASVVTDAHGPLYEAALRGNLFMAHAIVTAPVIYTTAAGTGGPLIWNGSTNRNVSILAIGWGVTTVTTVAAALGITGNTGQTSAPTSTTAIDSSRNLFLGGSASAATAYRVGTVTNAGNFLIPLGDLHTGALTTEPGSFHWILTGGFPVVPPNTWVSLAASATATTTVIQAGIIWEETVA